MRTTTLIAAVSALGVVFAGCAQVPSMPERPEPPLIADLAKPGTVLIQTTYVADITYPSLGLNEQAFGQLVWEAERAAPYMSQEDLLSAIIEELLTNFNQYFYAARPLNTVRAQIDGVGSGFFVTDDGYIVTNAHVVTDDPNQLSYALVENALAQLIEQDVRDFTSELGGQVSQRHVEMMKEVAVNFYVEHLQIGQIQRSVVAHLGANVGGVFSTTKPVEAEVIPGALGEPIPGKDVAILKVSGDGYPPHRIGDDKRVSVGEQIYPYGYPADATFFPAFDVSSINEPSITAGLVSSKKQMQGGWEVIQTDAAIRGGNSGGPVFDKNGSVIGLSTFGLRDAATGGDAVGANFVVPMTVVNEFLQRANVTPSEGQVAQLWREATLLRHDERHSAAVERLRKVDALRPGMPAVQASIQDSERAVLSGEDKGGPPVALIGGIAGAVAAVMVIVFVASRGRKPAVAGTAGPMISSAPAQQLPPQPEPPASPPPSSQDQPSTPQAEEPPEQQS